MLSRKADAATSRPIQNERADAIWRAPAPPEPAGGVSAGTRSDAAGATQKDETMATNEDVRLWTRTQVENAQAFAVGHGRQHELYAEARKIVPGGRALEIGFGDGHLLRLLSQSYECHAADISEENVEQMRAAVPSVEFRVAGTDGKLPYPDGFFDLFVASEVLEHMDDAQLAVAVAEIGRVLKPGGHALVTVPAREDLSLNECYCPNCGHHFHKWGHKQSWTRARIEETFRSFRIRKLEERYFTGDHLNLFGKIEALVRRAASRFREMSGLTFLVILEK